MPILHSIHYYPIKGTHAIDVQEASVEPRGIAEDRRWMLVDEKGRFLSQREEPRLALIRTEVHPSSLRVEAPGMPLLMVSRPVRSTRRQRVQIWGDSVDAVSVRESIHAWFTQFLGRPCTLVYMDAASTRPVDPVFAIGHNEVSFADGYPLLLTSLGSLEALNQRLGAAVPMNRFRPNLVIAETDAFAEDRWQRIRVGRVVFHVVKPCARCVVTTIDQESAVQSKEPLRTLREFRARNGKVYFGQNLIPATSGTVRIGDSVEILEMAKAASPDLVRPQ